MSEAGLAAKLPRRGRIVTWNQQDGCKSSILFLTDNFLPHAGGARVYYFNLYKQLAMHFGTQVTVLTKKTRDWQDFDRRHSTEAFRIVRRLKPLKSWKYLELPKGLMPMLEAAYRVHHDGVDVVHFGDLYPPGLISMALHYAFGVPYLAYCHGEEVTLTDRFRYQPKVRDQIYHRAQIVVAANEFARENLRRIGIPDSRIRKILPGVDCERFRPLPRSSVLATKFALDQKLVLLSVARLCARKNHRAVLRALAKLKNDYRNVVYLIVGEGEEQDSLGKLTAELGIGAMVRFVGYVPEDELPDYYNLADVFVLANREEANGDVEGFGMVFLEANACGKPVVAGLSGGTREAVVHGSTGMLINPDDVQELTAALRLLLADAKARQHMGEEGLRRARSEFSWMRSAEALHAANQEIMSMRQHARLNRNPTTSAHGL